MIKPLSESKKLREYNHVLCTMSRCIHDARTINLASSLVKKGDRVAVIGYATEQDVSDWDEQSLGFDFYYMSWPEYDRMFKLWASYLSSAMRIRQAVSARTLWAMDLYSVPLTFILKSLRGRRINYDAREIYSALGTNAKQPAKQKIITFIERFFIHKADKVAVTGELDSQYLVDEYGITPPEILLNLPVLNTWNADGKLRRDLNIPDNHDILIYQGLIYKGRGVDRLISVLPYLENVTFVAIGPGAVTDIKKCQELANELKVGDRFKWKPPVPYSELMSWTADADLGICFIEPLTLSLKYALPNKLFEYTMAGIPVLATNLPQMDSLLKEIPAGRTVSPDIDSKSLAAKIEDMLKSKNNGNFDPFIRQMRNRYHWDAQMPVIDRLRN